MNNQVVLVKITPATRQVSRTFYNSTADASRAAARGANHSLQWQLTDRRDVTRATYQGTIWLIGDDSA